MTKRDAVVLVQLPDLDYLEVTEISPAEFDEMLAQQKDVVVGVPQYHDGNGRLWPKPSDEVRVFVGCDPAFVERKEP